MRARIQNWIFNAITTLNAAAVGAVFIAAAIWPASAHAAGSWWKDAVFYEIFVRSFQDTNGDGAGDIKGITSRLGYLSDLGVNALWLTPIFNSPSYHGYDATDYKSINPDFGSLDDFKEMVAAAHQRGLRVVLDLAINHTSIKHPWFKANHDWYCWRNTVPAWPDPLRWHHLGSEYYYAFFSPSLPDLNWKNPEVVAEMKSTLHYWSELGVDGFRLDAARYYVEGPNGEFDTPETHAAIRDFVKSVKADFPTAMFVGEIWASSEVISSYVNSGDELDLAFNFPVAGGLLGALQSGTAEKFNDALEGSVEWVQDQARLAPFITNHDQVRAATTLGGSLAKLRVAATALLTLPGTPFLYYGEEIGLPEGTDPSDLGKRTPMQWTAAAEHGFTTAVKPWNEFSSALLSVESQFGVKGTLLNYYQQLISRRKAQPILRDGSFALLATGNTRVAAYTRTLEGRTAVVLLNFGNVPARNIVLHIPGVGAKTKASMLWGKVDFRNSTVKLLQPTTAAIVLLEN